MTNTKDLWSPSGEPGSVAGTACRLGVAAALVVSGLVHVQLYYDGFRDFPDPNLGRSVIVNGLASIVAAIVLVFRRDFIVRVGAAGLLVATLVSFVVSRTDTGIFGFTERGLNPSPQAGLALAANIIGLILVAATLMPAIGAGRSIPVVPAVVAAAGLGAGFIVGAAMWAREDDPVMSSPVAATTVPPVAPNVTAGAPPTTGHASSASTSHPTAVAPATAAPTTSTASPPAAPTPSSSGVQPSLSGVRMVTIVDFAFDAAALEVPVGTTVRWVNNDQFAHSVVAADDSFVSDNLQTGATFEFTFNSVGTFDYICGIHPSMLGQVKVTG